MALVSYRTHCFSQSEELEIRHKARRWVVLRRYVFSLFGILAAIVWTFVDEPPIRFNRPLSRDSTPRLAGNTEVLFCDASGVPAPVYRWLKNGYLLAPSNSSNTRLTITSIHRSDAGSYQCIASNALGSLLSLTARIDVTCRSSHYMQT